MATEVEIYLCDACGHSQDDEPDSPLYECSSDGTQFVREGSYDQDSNRCPECRKFAAKTEDYGCSECQGAGMFLAKGFRCDRCGTSYATRLEAENCESEDLVPKSVKEARKREARMKIDAEHERWHQEAIAAANAITAADVLAEWDDRLKYVAGPAHPGSKEGISLNLHVMRAIRDVIAAHPGDLDARLKEHSGIYV